MTTDQEIKLSESCPARCKRTEKCYEKAVFLGKTGKSKDCLGNCKYIKRLIMIEGVKENG